MENIKCFNATKTIKSITNGVFAFGIFIIFNNTLPIMMRSTFGFILFVWFMYYMGPLIRIMKQTASRMDLIETTAMPVFGELFKYWSKFKHMRKALVDEISISLCYSAITKMSIGTGASRENFKKYFKMIALSKNKRERKYLLLTVVDNRISNIERDTQIEYSRKKKKAGHRSQKTLCEITGKRTATLVWCLGYLKEVNNPDTDYIFSKLFT